ncbi:MAG: DUF2510 domain-containing protein [Salinibacterium sp.]|nr:DUF2510 domain-containing protein [Salinibacterium sp.]
MSTIEHTKVPAGWYSDGVANGSLRWWDGRDWTTDVRPVAAPVLVSVEPAVVDYVPGISSIIEPTLLEQPHAFPTLLTLVPERSASAQLSTTALTRRQLRERLGGPLVTDAPPDQRASV